MVILEKCKNVRLHVCGHVWGEGNCFFFCNLFYAASIILQIVGDNKILCEDIFESLKHGVFCLKSNLRPLKTLDDD